MSESSYETEALLVHDGYEENKQCCPKPVVITLKVLYTILLIPFMVVLVTLVHEAGFMFTGIGFGGKVEYFELFGMVFYPKLSYSSNWWPNFGETQVTGSFSWNQLLWQIFMGSGATYAISLLFQISFWIIRWSNYFVQIFLLFGCWWCMELFYHTMPTIGIPEFIFWGFKGYDPSFSQSYFAAVEFGLKPWIFQALTFGTCGILVVLSLTRLIILNTDPLVSNQKEEYMYDFDLPKKKQSSVSRFMNNIVRKHIAIVCLAFVGLVIVVDVFAVVFGTHPTVPSVFQK